PVAGALQPRPERLAAAARGPRLRRVQARLHDRWLPAALHRRLVRRRPAWRDRHLDRLDPPRDGEHRAQGNRLGANRMAELDDGLRQAARRFGTPVAVTDLATLDAATATLRAAFPEPWLRHFSVKANDVAAIVGLIAQRGFGANVVSAGEWRIARRA